MSAASSSGISTPNSSSRARIRVRCSSELQPSTVSVEVPSSIDSAGTPSTEPITCLSLVSSIMGECDVGLGAEMEPVERRLIQAALRRRLDHVEAEAAEEVLDLGVLRGAQPLSAEPLAAAVARIACDRLPRRQLDAAAEHAAAHEERVDPGGEA